MSVSPLGGIARIMLCAWVGTLLWGPVVCQAGGPAGVSIAASAPGTVLTAGEAVTVRWAGVPADADEMELLLLIEEGGRPLRLTPQLSPGRGGFVWVVPNLPGTRARLSVRYGLRGREIVGPISGIIRIVGRSDRLPGRVGYHDGEWWLQAMPTKAPDEGTLRRASVHRPEAATFADLAAPAPQEPDSVAARSADGNAPRVVSTRVQAPPVVTESPRRPRLVVLRE